MKYNSQTVLLFVKKMKVDNFFSFIFNFKLDKKFLIHSIIIFKEKKKTADSRNKKNI